MPRLQAAGSTDSTKNGAKQQSSSKANKSLLKSKNTNQQVVTPSSGSSPNAQQVNVLSSDEMYSMSSHSNAGFAGFSPAGDTKKISLKRPSQQSVIKNAKDYEELRHKNSVMCSEKPTSLVSLDGSDDGDVERDIDGEQITPTKRLKQQEAFEKYAPDALAAGFVEPHIGSEDTTERFSNSATGSKKKRSLNCHKTETVDRKLAKRSPSNNKYVNNKCSSESTSDFPVSSPSNPLPTGKKYSKRPALLKNTLPANGFERDLALVMSTNPQMTLEDKMRNWHCETDLSDVEDVNNFDDLFKKYEEEKRKLLRGKCLTSGSSVVDFTQFRNKILDGLKTQLRRKCRRSTRDGEKPTTSTAAVIARRSRPVAAETVAKKRHSKGSAHVLRSAGCSSTSTPSEKHTQAKKSQQPVQQAAAQPAILVYEKALCPSSSEDATPDDRTHKLKKSPPFLSGIQQKGNCNTYKGVSTSNQKASPLNANWNATNESPGFRLNRLNPEIDKNRVRQGLIQLRLDFLNKDDLHLKEKKCEIFKTPTIPQKYLTPVPQKLYVNSKYFNKKMNKMNNNIIINRSTDAKITYSKKFSTDKANCSESTKTANTAYITATPQSGVFHQQHEFCNYLGLTGMSTANAVANAVAELAKCNLTRRSLRVRRQQQREKKDKELEATKKTQETSPSHYDGGSVADFNVYASKSLKASGSEGAGSFSLHSSIKTPFSAFRQRLCVHSTVTAPVLSTATENLRSRHHLVSSQKREITRAAHDYCKLGTPPGRLTLSQQLQYNAITSSNGTSTCPRSSQSECDEIYDSSSNRSPKRRLSGGGETNCPTPILYSPRSTNRCARIVNGLHNNSQQRCLDSPIDPTNPQTKDSIATINVIHKRFQKYLEDSRQAKPSIYIVKALDNDNYKRVAASDLKDPQIHIVASMKHVCDATRNPSLKTPPPSDSNRKNEQKPMPQNQVLNGGVLSRKEKPHNMITRSSATNLLVSPRRLRNNKVLSAKLIRPDLKSKLHDKTNKAADKAGSAPTPARSVKPRIRTPTKAITPSAMQNLKMVKCNIMMKNFKSENGNSPSVDASRRPSSASVSKLRASRSLLLKKKAIKFKNMPPKSVSKAIVSTDAKLNCSPTVTLEPLTSLETAKKVSNYNSMHAKEINKKKATTPPKSSDAPSRTAQVPQKSTKEPVSANSINVLHSVETKESCTQSNVGGIHYLVTPTVTLCNPLKDEYGPVHYMYYEMDMLIVVQELLVSFWKYSKILNMLSVSNSMYLYRKESNKADPNNPTDGTTRYKADANTDWVYLGQCKRLLRDHEIFAPYANRLCVHNSIPIYIEMRHLRLPNERRDCSLLSLYINVYFYNDEEMIAKSHSIQIDTVQSSSKHVLYTTITESRYFIMCFLQENILNKTRTGLCKYSLTPQLDTLASIREFKSLSHQVRQLDCLGEDKLIGIGITQLTVWDHRSGDVLMNFDLTINLGRNLGFIHYSTVEMGQPNMLLLFQFICEMGNEPELVIIACNISHNAPAYRILQRQQLPSPQFNEILNAVNTSEHIVITAQSDDEIWISCSDPHMITCVPSQNTRRYYTRGRTQLVELTSKTLTVDSFANHILKLAAGNVISF